MCSRRCTVITTRAKIIKLNITPTVPTDSATIAIEDVKQRGN